MNFHNFIYRQVDEFRRFIKDKRYGVLPVSSASSRFLHITLNRGGMAKVYRESDVLLVDAHAEGLCGNHQVQFVGIE